MGSVNVDGYQASQYFVMIEDFLKSTPAAKRDPLVKKSAGVYQFEIKNKNKSQIWTLNLKDSEPSVTTSPPSKKADISIKIEDKDFVELAQGKLNGQKAFMQGKLKATGNFGLAGKLDGFFKEARQAAGSTTTATKTTSESGTSDSATSPKSLEVDGFKSSAVFKKISAWMNSISEEQRKKEVQKVKGLFQINVKSGKKTQTWTIDLKNGNGDAYVGAPKQKADAVITISDEDFLEMAAGKLNGQKAFMTGKLKIQGQMMLATKLDPLFKSIGQSKL